MTAPESFDVIIVGARCAGSPLATLLTRAGLRVAVVEQATFPRDTLSTHCLHAQALSFLDRLGVTERIRATGAPYLRHYDLRQDDLEVRADIPQPPGDIGGIASVRRFLLDPILADTDAESGADIRMGARVTGLLEDRGRVSGYGSRETAPMPVCERGLWSARMGATRPWRVSLALASTTWRRTSVSHIGGSSKVPNGPGTRPSSFTAGPIDSCSAGRRTLGCCR